MPMHSKFLSLLAVLLLFALLSPACLAAQTVSGDADGVSVSLPDQYTVFTPDNLSSKTAELAALSETTDTMSARLAKDQALFLAVGKDNTAVELTSFSDTLSETVGDLICLDTAERAKVEKALIGSTESSSAADSSAVSAQPDSGTASESTVSVSEIEQQGALFYRVEHTDSGTAAILYITIMNSRCYTLSFFDYTGSLSSNDISMMQSVFKSFTYSVAYEEEAVMQHSVNAKSVFTWVLIALAAVCIVLLILSLSRELKYYRLERERRSNTRKKPRR